jgi:hypothetical protein
MTVEKIFVLTQYAFYLCVYDYMLEKVTAFKRVPLRKIIQIQKGDFQFPAM